ncbi:hypothetical protein [Nocardia farcinica]|uniref:hypothetical protein n=1 Tax=Nocardia farcinica TaxID=37329 RepID=UPI001145E33B|nr:hypothetical protein [Nocardia farcinica]
MPKRTNAFQKLVATITAHLSAGAIVTESKMLIDLDTGQEREVDICIEQDVAGHPLRICIECSSHQRARDVTWVEQMHAKHQRLHTNLLVLASESGFTGSALKKAESYGIQTAVPGHLSESFGSDLVGKLNALWVKTFALTPTKMRMWVEESADRPEEIIVAFPDTLIFRGDNTEVTDALSMARGLVQNLDMDNDAMRDAQSDEKFFTVGMEPAHLRDPKTGELYDIYLRKEEPTGDHLRRITRVEVTGAAVVEVAEIPLKHGEFRGVGYSAGSAMLGDRTVSLVATETPQGERRTTTRFEPHLDAGRWTS